jgi:hypothetical protein
MNDIRPLSAHTGAEIHGVDVGQSFPDKKRLFHSEPTCTSGVTVTPDGEATS